METRPGARPVMSLISESSLHPSKPDASVGSDGPLATRHLGAKSIMAKCEVLFMIRDRVMLRLGNKITNDLDSPSLV